MSKHDKKNWHQFKDKNQPQKDPDVEMDGVEEPIHQEEIEHASYAELSEKLTLAEQTAHENWEQSVRAKAELENVRRRAEQEIAKAHRYGVEKLISAILPIIDSLEQALQMAVKEGDTAMTEGLELTLKLFMDVLQKFDVQQINPLGTPFDPQEHEAMTMQDAPDTAPNTVLEVCQKGYKLSDRVIRPARVLYQKNNY